LDKSWSSETMWCPLAENTLLLLGNAPCPSFAENYLVATYYAGHITCSVTSLLLKGCEPLSITLQRCSLQVQDFIYYSRVSSEPLISIVHHLSSPNLALHGVLRSNSRHQKIS
jgi:hypothetical protein